MSIFAVFNLYLIDEVNKLSSCNYSLLFWVVVHRRGRYMYVTFFFPIGKVNDVNIVTFKVHQIARILVIWLLFYCQFNGPAIVKFHAQIVFWHIFPFKILINVDPKQNVLIELGQSKHHVHGYFSLSFLKTFGFSFYIHTYTHT